MKVEIDDPEIGPRNRERGRVPMRKTDTALSLSFSDPGAIDALSTNRHRHWFVRICSSFFRSSGVPTHGKTQMKCTLRVLLRLFAGLPGLF